MVGEEVSPGSYKVTTADGVAAQTDKIYSNYQNSKTRVWKTVAAILN